MHTSVHRADLIDARIIHTWFFRWGTLDWIKLIMLHNISPSRVIKTKMIKAKMIKTKAIITKEI